MKSFLEALRIRSTLFSHNSGMSPAPGASPSLGAVPGFSPSPSPGPLSQPVHPEVLESVVGIALVQHALGRYGVIPSSPLSSSLQNDNHHINNNTNNNSNINNNSNNNNPSAGENTTDNIPPAFPPSTYSTTTLLSSSDKVIEGFGTESVGGSEDASEPTYKWLADKPATENPYGPLYRLIHPPIYVALHPLTYS